MKKNQRQPATNGQTVTEEIVRVAPGVWSTRGGAEVYNLVKDTPVPEWGGNGGKRIKIPYGNDGELAELWSWGTNNLLPQEREQLLMENNIVPELIATKMAITLGTERIFFEKKFMEGKQVIEEVEVPQWWLDLEERSLSATRMGFDDLFDMAMKNLFLHANAPVEFVRNLKGEVGSIEAWDCINARPAVPNDRGYIEDWYWCGSWKEWRSRKADFPIMRSAGYNYSDYFMAQPGRTKPKTQGKFVLHIMDNLLHDGVLGIPGWWGGRKWISTSNKIPNFHESNIDNGYFLKLHVEMPKDYFTNARAYDQAKTTPEFADLENKESAARAAFMKKVNDLFTGADGNKVIFTEFELNKQIGKDFPGIKIHVLETNKLDESMLKLFNASNEAVISGQGLHPSLAGIQTQGKLSSGSELRNSLNIYTAIKAPRYRRMIGKIYETARRINAPGSNVMMGFRDIEVTNLDEQPMGMEAKGGANEPMEV